MGTLATAIAGCAIRHECMVCANAGTPISNDVIDADQTDRLWEER
jgi:hypothetical protein